MEISNVTLETLSSVAGVAMATMIVVEYVKDGVFKWTKGKLSTKAFVWLVAFFLTALYSFTANPFSANLVFTVVLNTFAAATSAMGTHNTFRENEREAFLRNSTPEWTYGSEKVGADERGNGGN